MAQINHRLTLIPLLLGLTTGCYSPITLSKAKLTSQVQEDIQASQSRVLQGLRADENQLSLTVEEAMKLAQDSSRSIQVREADLVFNEAKIFEAGQIRNPELRYSQEKIENGFGDDTRMDVEFRVRPPRPGEIGARQSAARSVARAARASLEREKNRVNSRVRTLFREVGFVEAEIQASKSSRNKENSSSILPTAHGTGPGHPDGCCLGGDCIS